MEGWQPPMPVDVVDGAGLDYARWQAGRERAGERALQPVQLALAGTFRCSITRQALQRQVRVTESVEQVSRHVGQAVEAQSGMAGRRKLRWRGDRSRSPFHAHRPRRVSRVDEHEFVTGAVLNPHQIRAVAFGCLERGLLSRREHVQSLL
ncbi:hypothetical protein FQZ97_1003760 [compost metagenome]